MNRAPSLKRLEAAFPGCGSRIRALLKKQVKPSAYQSVRDLDQWSYNPQRCTVRLMTALNEVIGGYGVECLERNGEPVAYYVNQGDTYAVTLIRKLDTGSILVTSWGDFAESNRL